MTQQTHFRRQPNGSYAFDAPQTGVTYYAYRNEAGFAGRQWYVTRLDSIDVETIVADQLASRKECVEVAFEDATADAARQTVARVAANTPAATRLDTRFVAVEGGAPGGPTVRIFDLKYVDRFGPEGQFVSDYYATSIANRPAGVALSMWSDIPEWTLSPAAADNLRAFAQSLVA